MHALDFEQSRGTFEGRRGNFEGRIVKIGRIMNYLFIFIYLNKK